MGGIGTDTSLVRHGIACCFKWAAIHIQQRTKMLFAFNSTLLLLLPQLLFWLLLLMSHLHKGGVAVHGLVQVPQRLGQLPQADICRSALGVQQRRLRRLLCKRVPYIRRGPVLAGWELGS